MGFYVRTSSGGTGVDYFLRDLGITISTSATWTELSLYNSSGFSTGQFTVEELAASQDLYDGITQFWLEASTDGYVNDVDGYTYSPIFPIVHAVLNSPSGIDLSNSSLVLPNTLDAATLILSPSPGQVAFDNDDGYVVYYDGYTWKKVGEGNDLSVGGVYTGIQDFSGSEFIIPNGSVLPGQPTTEGRLYLVNDAGNMKLYASDGTEWDLIGPTFGGGGGGGDSLWYLDGYLVQLISDGYILRVDEVQLSNNTVVVGTDGLGRMTFQDQYNPTPVTLDDLLAGSGFSPGYWTLSDGYVITPETDGYIVRADEYQVTDGRIQITSDGYGNLILQDISGITSLTALKSMRNIWIQGDGYSPGNITLSDSTNWGAQYTYISRINVDTDSTDWDLWICETSSFDTNISTSRRVVRNGLRSMDVQVGVEVNADGENVYLIYADNSGTNVANFYVTGEARRH